MLPSHATHQQQQLQTQHEYPHLRVFDDQIEGSQPVQNSKALMPISHQHLYQQHHALQLQKQRMQIASSSNLPSLQPSHLQQLGPIFIDPSLTRSQTHQHHLHSPETLSFENATQTQSTVFQSSQRIAVPSTSSDDKDKKLLKRPVPGQPYGNLLNAEFVLGNRLKVNSFEPPSCPVDSNWGCFVYYERETQIGRLQVKHANMYIDGGFGQASNRYCLGRENNPLREPDCHLVR
uniref:MH2 domain-containing protein n=1 Tax=Angiostrongylus cantonensis TaxID=6313 RepID=A0A0K0D810_ANGCA